jgi:hypothetical protein
MTLIDSIRTELAFAAHARDPLDACPVAFFPEILNIGAHSYNGAGTLMASNSMGLGLHCYA